LTKTVQTPGSGSGRHPIKEADAVQDGYLSTVQQRPEVLRVVSPEIGDGHLATKDERGRPREEAHQNERPQNDFNPSGEL